MTLDKCREVLGRYDKMLMGNWAGPSEDAVRHLLTMIPTMRGMLDEIEATGNQYAAINVPRMEKFMRWLGFMQGVLYNEGICTLEELKAHNRPTELTDHVVDAFLTTQPDTPDPARLARIKAHFDKKQT